MTERFIYTCDKCGRTIVPEGNEEEWRYWLYSDVPLGKRLVVRCPRHITEWTLRQAGWPRTTAIRRWAQQASDYGDTMPVITNEFYMPYPIDGPFKETK